MMGREKGFYWVQRETGLWEVAEWYSAGEDKPYNGCWLLAGTEDNFGDNELVEIDENRIERE